MNTKETSSQTLRAAVYCRISEDKEDDQLGVERQRKDCLKLVVNNGWIVVADGSADTFTDNDISGAKDATERKAFCRLINAIQAGQVDVVVAYKQARLYRHTMGLLEFCDLARSAGVESVAFVADPDIDLNGTMLVSTVIAAVDSEYRRGIGELMRRKHVELAERGLPSGGVRTFGYNGPRRIKGTTTEKYVEPDPTAEPYSIYEPEALAIRWAYKYLLEEGGSLKGVQREWIDRGVPTVRGGVRADGTPAWNRTSIRRILTGAAIAGLRVRKGAVVGPAAWDAIVSEDDRRAVVAVLKDPSRRHFSSEVRRYPLRGMCVCGACGRRLSGLARTNKGKQVRFYACRREPGGCGDTWVTAHNLENYVMGTAVAVAESSDAIAMIEAESGVQADELRALIAEREETRANLARIEDAWAKGDMTDEGYNRNRRTFQKAITAAQERITAIEASSVLGRVDGSLLTSWANLGFSEQRTVIQSLVAEVQVMPKVKKGGRFDPRRVCVTWRSSAVALAAGIDEWPTDHLMPEVLAMCAVATTVALGNVRDAEDEVPAFVKDAVETANWHAALGPMFTFCASESVMYAASKSGWNRNDAMMTGLREFGRFHRT
jgi:DNA invertase Pin-like site-specific DNA recombinase